MFKFKAYFPKTLEILEDNSMKNMFKAVYHVLLENSYNGYDESVKIINNFTGKTVCEIGCYGWMDGSKALADIRVNGIFYKLVVIAE